MKLTKERLKLPSEDLRLEIKEIADAVRYRFIKKGIIDIFDVLENEAFFIRKPLESMEVSGFSTYFDGKFIVMLNSSYTLGHERYTGGHELYHIVCNDSILKKDKLIEDSKYQDEDRRADIFAAEFLMPEDYIKELFYKLVDIEPNKIEPRHIVRLNNELKVSYKAMLKRLVQLDLCSIDLYEHLASYGTNEKSLELQEITKKEGYDISLIMPSKKSYVSKEYIEISRKNYEENKISYTKITELLECAQRNPKDYGYDPDNKEEDDLV
ncbi:MAG: ImmA/IrrE family metallo-endopeptidase [Romboutsia sp.]